MPVPEHCRCVYPDKCFCNQWGEDDMPDNERSYDYTTRTYRVRLTFSHDAPLPDDGALMVEVEKLLAGETLAAVAGSRAYVVIEEVEIDDHA